MKYLLSHKHLEMRYMIHSTEIILMNNKLMYVLCILQMLYMPYSPLQVQLIFILCIWEGFRALGMDRLVLTDSFDDDWFSIICFHQHSC